MLVKETLSRLAVAKRGWFKPKTLVAISYAWRNPMWRRKKLRLAQEKNHTESKGDRNWMILREPWRLSYSQTFQWCGPKHSFCWRQCQSHFKLKNSWLRFIRPTSNDHSQIPDTCIILWFSRGLHLPCSPVPMCHTFHKQRQSFSPLFVNTDFILVSRIFCIAWNPD